MIGVDQEEVKKKSKKTVCLRQPRRKLKTYLPYKKRTSLHQLNCVIIARKLESVRDHVAKTAYFRTFRFDSCLQRATRTFTLAVFINSFS